MVFIHSVICVKGTRSPGQHHLLFEVDNVQRSSLDAVCRARALGTEVSTTRCEETRERDKVTGNQVSTTCCLKWTMYSGHHWMLCAGLGL